MLESWANPAVSIIWLRSKLAWLSTTPLGSPVLPEVYCRNATLSGPSFGGDQLDRSPASAVESHLIFASPSDSRATAPFICMRSGLVSANRASQSAAMASSTGKVL